MLNWFIQHKKEVFLITTIVALMASIRHFENHLFYDPFLKFFEYDLEKYPTYDSLLLNMNIFFRYFINSILSIIILKILFKEKVTFKNLIIVYLSLFFVFIVIHFIFLNLSETYKMLLFYTRRILIQPILLILLIPAFYYNFHIPSEKNH